MKKFTVSLLFCLVASVAGSCCYHDDCNKDTEYCNSKSGCTFSRRRRGDCVPKKKDGETVESVLMSFAYNKCASGDGACGVCSSTCKTDKGCRVVGERGKCSEDNDCLDGLYCDTGSDFLSLACGGVCLAKCRQFSDVDTQDLCDGLDALVYARAAYSASQHYCCTDGATFSFSEKPCEGGEVQREACDGNADCEAQCKKVFYESPFEDFTDEEWNGYTEPLKDLQKHEEHSHLLVGGNSFGFTAHRGSTLVVAFKGTDDAGDGMADLNFIPNKFTVESRDGRKESFWGHRGFIQYYEGIREKVIAAVEQTGSSVPQDVHELLVSGHSLGGAMATLCAVDLAVRYPDMKVSLYTYGSPRVFMGNTKEANNMNSAFHVHQILSTAPNSYHRYMVNGDPVPTAPLENMGFMHCGDGLELNDGGRSTCEHCHMDHTKMVKDVENHFGVTYTRLIKAAKPAQCSPKKEL